MSGSTTSPSGQALALLRQGRGAQAHELLRAYLEEHREDAEAQFLAAQCAAKLGRVDDVAEHCRLVLAIDPGHFGARFNRAVALQHLGDAAAAAQEFERCLCQESRHLGAVLGLGRCRLAQARYPEAAGLLRRAVELQPADDAVVLELALALQGSGDLAQTRELVRQLASRPLSPALQYRLSKVELDLGWTDMATALLREVVRREPRHVGAWNDLGHLLYEAGQLQEARSCFERTCALAPDNALGHFNRALALQDTGELAEAERALREAIRLAPGEARPRSHLGFLLADQGRFEEAMAVFAELLAREPGNREALTGQAHVLERRDRVEEGLALLEPVIMAGERDPGLVRAYVSLSARSEESDRAIAVAEEAIRAPGLPLKAQIDLHFALGQLHDRRKDYPRAWRHFVEGNRIAPSGFSPARFHAEVDSIIKNLPEGVDVRGVCDDERPVLIVGLPRSGTSLVEQILDAHPMVHGAGERMELSQIARESGYPTSLLRVPESVLAGLARGYLDSLSAQAGNAVRITDKMPHNFLYLGLAARLFSRARIVHVRRHPLDTCLSLYFQSFNAAHGYSTGLESLANYYRAYHALMSHWERVLGPRLYPLSYERLVGDCESETRRLVEFLGLPWDAACLEFHSSGRYCPTPSYHQVRQPIYAGSVGRWRHYAEQLEPLRERLSDLVEAYA